ncbi:MAG: DUF6062 family protein [Candidatus Bathyarchaeia archaeon]
MRHDDKGIMQVHISQALEKEKHCFLCHLEGTLEQRYVEVYLSELVMDPKAREKIVASRGFCNYHFYKMFVSATNPASEDCLGMALILKSVTGQLLEDVKDQRHMRFIATKSWKLDLKRSAGSIRNIKLSKPVSNEAECPACDHISKMMRLYIEEFLDGIIQNEEMWELYDKSKGMCMPHYVMTLYIANSISNGKFEQTIKKLVEKQIQALERIQKDLSEYIEKQDYRFSTSERARTEESVGRGLKQLVGKRGIEKTLAKILRTRQTGFP